MRKEYIKDFKRVNLIATIFDPAHSEDEDYDEIVFPLLIPTSEWDRLIYDGEFSFYFDKVIDGYSEYISLVTKVRDIHICFEEIKNDNAEVQNGSN